VPDSKQLDNYFVLRIWPEIENKSAIMLYIGAAKRTLFPDVYSHNEIKSLKKTHFYVVFL